MQTLEALKQQIGSTEDLGSVVGTMKALSAVHIRKYERAVQSLRRYDQTLALGLHAVLSSRAVPDTPRGGGGAGRTGIVVFGSDYGLCGRFNDELATHALAALDRLGVARERRLVAAVGARAATALRARGEPPQREVPATGSVGGIEARARGLLLTIDAWRSRDGAERVLLVHHRHRAPSEQRIQAVQMLPVDLARFRRRAEAPWPSRRIPTFSMDAERLLASLLRQLLSVSLFRALAESAASEHASRLQSMQAAQRNIEDKLEELTAEFRRRRQDGITAELLDVVSGYEALAGPDAQEA